MGFESFIPELSLAAHCFVIHGMNKSTIRIPCFWFVVFEWSICYMRCRTSDDENHSFWLMDRNEWNWSIRIHLGYQDTFQKIFKGILVIFLKRLYGKRYYLFYYFYLYVLKWFVPKKIGKMTKSGQVWAIGFISMMSIFFGHRHASLCPILKLLQKASRPREGSNLGETVGVEFPLS